MDCVMKLFPEMFRIWVTKHVPHFLGTNQQLSRIDKLVLNGCPSCNCHDVSTSHITWCRDPRRTHILKDSVEQLVQRLYDQQTDDKVVQLFKRYLPAGGMRILTSLLKPNSRLGVEVWFHDNLGWDCFLEGQLCALWVEHRAQHIQRANLTPFSLSHLEVESLGFSFLGIHNPLLVTDLHWWYLYKLSLQSVL